MKNYYFILGAVMLCLTGCHKRTDPGTLGAAQCVDIVARVNGYLTAKAYTSGDWVKQGQLLFRIEDRNYRDEVTQAEAALATARGNLEYASAHYKAMTEAIKDNAVSSMEVAQAKSSLVQAEAAVSNAQAALQTARTQLSYCTVTAPFDGHMSGAEYDVGAYVGGAGAPVKLASIYHDKSMIASFAVEDNASLGSLRRNIAAGNIDYHHIPVKFSETTAHQYYADLYFQAPTVNTSTGTMALKAKVDNPYDTPVKTGNTVRDSLRIITSGIGPDDRYVTKAIMKVRDGMEVKPVLTDSVVSQKR